MRSKLVVLIGSVLLTACGGGGHSSSGQASLGSQNSSSLSSSQPSSQSSISLSSSQSSLSSQISSSFSSSQGSVSSSQSSAQSVNYSELISTPQTKNALVLTNESAFIHHLKNGIRLKLMNGYNGGGHWGAQFIEISPTPPRPSVPEFVSAEDRSSQRNEYVEGIDEADYAKYDGTHWFISRFSKDDGGHNLPGIQVVKTNVNTPTIEIVGEFSFDKLWGNPADMYLVQQGDDTTHVAVIRSLEGDVNLALPGSLLGGSIDYLGYNSFWYKNGLRHGQTRIQLIDVKNPEAPTNDWDIKIDGSLISSKKIGNILYLLTRYDSWVNELDYGRGLYAKKESNEELVAAATATDLLPYFQIGSNKQLLTTQCLLQNGTEGNHGLDNLVYVTAVDLVNKKLISSQCLNSGVETFYMSTEALYLTGTVYNEALEGNKTVIHKFSLGDVGPNYVATGSIPGYLWRSGNAEFRMNEYQGDLRILTSDWGEDVRHQLFILEENNGDLVTVSTLPNSARPDSIGQPNEEIYSVRFDKERAFVSTFNQSGPLYVLDLSDRLDPKSVNEIETLGFATYLHPINENYMLTLGPGLNERGRFRGIKVELVNISQDSPKVIDTLLLASRFGYSKALDNLHALSLLRVNKDQLRIAMPIDSYNALVQFIPVRSLWQYNGLQLLEVNGLNGTNARLTNAGVITAEKRSSSQGYPVYENGTSRNVLHHDAVFFFYNNSVWAADWNFPDLATEIINE